LATDHEALYPPALRGLDILACDCRAVADGGRIIGDGESLGVQKLIAGLLNVPLDALAERERVRQRRTMAALTTASVIFALVAIAAGALAFVAEQRRQQAFASLSRVMIEHGWTAAEAENYPLATRYALAAWRSVPANEASARALLAHVLFASGESEILLSGQEELAGAVLTQSGAIATLHQDAVALFDPASQSQLRRYETRFATWETPIFSHDGNHISTFSRVAGGLEVLNIETGAIESYSAAQDGFAQSAAVSPDGRRMAIGYTNLDFDTHSMSYGIGFFERGAMRPRRLATASPAGLVALDNRDSVAAIFETGELAFLNESGRVEWRANLSTSSPRHLLFSPDGQWLAAGAATGLVTVWRRDGRLAASIPARAPVTAMRFSNANDMIAIGYENGQILLFGTDGAMRASFRGHEAGIRSLVFTNDGASLLSAGGEGSARLWPLSISHASISWPGANISFDNAGSRILTFGGGGAAIRDATGALLFQSREFDSAEFAPGEASVLFSGWAGDALLTDLDGRVILRVDGALEDDGINFSHDGALVMHSVERNVRLYDARTGAFVRTVPRAEAPLRADYRPARQSVSPFVFRFSSQPDRATMYDARSGEIITYFERAVSAQVSRSAHLALLETRGGGARVVRLPSGEVAFELPGRPINVYMSDDGDLVAAIIEGAVSAWSVESGSPQFSLRLFDQSIRQAGFSRDFSFAVTLTHTGIVTLWDVAQRRAIFSTNVGPEVSNIAFDPSGRWIAASGVGSSQVLAWPLERLLSPIDQLFERACGRFLDPSARTFSTIERRADPLIDEVWPAREGDAGDLCRSR